METQNAEPKRTRQTPRVWARFFTLAKGQTFDLGSKHLYQKSNFLFASQRRGYRLVLPWKKVRTFTLVRDARPGGKSSAPTATVLPN